MAIENSSEQYKPRETPQINAGALIPSNAEYQNFFRPSASRNEESGFLDFGDHDIYGDQSIKVAQDLTLPFMPTLVPSPEQLGITDLVIKGVKDIAEATAQDALQKTSLQAEKTWNPYRGEITAEMNKIPASAWHQAYEVFPQFREAKMSETQTKELLQAIIRNELYNYNIADKVDDEQTAKNGRPADLPKRPALDATLGDSQLSINAVVTRAQEYPEQLGPFKNREAEALLNPSLAPLLVAATLAYNIEMYNRHHIPVGEKTLAYSYNPPNGRILPDEKGLNGEHVKNVMHQLRIIRGQVETMPGER